MCLGKRSCKKQTFSRAAHTGDSRGINIKVQRVHEKVVIWLGEKGVKIIVNKAGDRIFLSADGRRKMRFDLCHCCDDRPHAHLQIKRDIQWKDATRTHRIYFQGSVLCMNL